LISLKRISLVRRPDSVRVPFHRKLAEGRLQLGFVGVPFDLKGLVVAALGGHSSNPLEVHSEVRFEKMLPSA